MDASIQKYQALAEAARSGSLTQAARHLSYTQSAVSRMVADLERDWGLTLLERSHGGVRPTRDGRLLLPAVEGVCDAHRRLRAQVNQIRGLGTGSICIGTFSSVATHILPEAMVRFQADFPEIDFELLMGDFTEIEAWAREGRVDLGVLPYEPGPAGLDWSPLLVDEHLAVVPEGHPLAAESEVGLERLAEEPFILLEKGDDDEVRPLFEAAGVELDARFVTWDDYAIMSMVESGLGVSVLPALILRRCPYRIRTLRLVPRAKRRVGVVCRDASTLPMAARRFLGYLLPDGMAGYPRGAAPCRT